VRIRSIAVGIDTAWPLDRAVVRDMGRFVRSARGRFEAEGLEVQTVRLALSPFAESRPADDPAWALEMACELELACKEQNIGYVSLGPVRWGRLSGERARAYGDVLSELVAATEIISVSVETAADGVLYAAAAASAGRTIAALARTTERGFGNFRFCTIAECPPNIPFFPSAYHAGGPPRFSLGLEAAGDVRAAFSRSGSLADLERALHERLGRAIGQVEQIAANVEDEWGVSYAGADLTPAPFPSDDMSAGGMLEDLGVETVGAAGTLAAAAAFTRMLKALPFRNVGFSGLMFPVLEDSILAARASEGLLSWSELLLYSAVCGTGLDTVPLPGDATAEELAGVILDTSALAVTLRKPLTCRLFPVPGKRAGEMTDYDFPYFANARVLPLKGRGSGRLFARLGA
jgi:uncharacterized protein (UPF0210 family)